MRVSVCSLGVVVALEAVAHGFVGNLRVADGETILHVAAESVIGVEIVVPTLVGNEVFAVYRAAEPLKGVIV